MLGFEIFCQILFHPQSPSRHFFSFWVLILASSLFLVPVTFERNSSIIKKYQIPSKNTKWYSKKNQVCVSSADCGAEKPFRFLKELKAKFPLFYNRPQNFRNQPESKEALATKFVMKIMDNYNSNSDSKVEKIEKEMDNVASLMKSNLGKVIDRGENIGNLMDKTDMLRSEAQRYRNTAKGFNDQVFVLIFFGIFFFHGGWIAFWDQKILWEF